jgi:TPR repeat protein
MVVGVYWYTNAAKRGLVDAQYNLGVVYANRSGTPKNKVLAHVWWNIAAVQGSKNDANNRNLIKKDMAPNQIAEAQELSKEYYVKYAK